MQMRLVAVVTLIAGAGHTSWLDIWVGKIVSVQQHPNAGEGTCMKT